MGSTILPGMPRWTNMEQRLQMEESLWQWTEQLKRVRRAKLAEAKLAEAKLAEAKLAEAKGSGLTIVHGVGGP